MALFETLDDSEKLLYNTQHAVKVSLNRGLDKAAEYLKGKLEQNSPDDKKTKSKKYKRQWKINRRYKNMRILYNAKMVNSPDGEIPLSNILEIQSPHMRKTFDDCADELADIILNEIEF
ncbi:hypothetical protein RBG61_01965 [Paludicola sp. MB14-C6]|uniref:hypothetical protein n=1 Tax=Paludihabitans sp. MB14-C6 TaxID=3070656 RepID=UPI0027DC9DB3|nr:hypothetical protein [Paludicola sp. MB14-C6]WMJ23457.1 hypothetical protein RBG61_01965 [Paludicola sp. MB14-C6]